MSAIVDVNAEEDASVRLSWGRVLIEQAVVFVGASLQCLVLSWRWCAALLFYCSSKVGIGVGWER